MINRESTLESRLLQFYITADIAWSLLNTLLYFLVGMPDITVAVYFIKFLFLVLFFCMGYVLKREKLFGEIYFVLIFFSKPFLWFFAGGARSSASILFVCELVLFVMCMRGLKQKIFIVLSFVSTSLIQGVSQRFGRPGFEMEPRQYQIGGSVLGITTCVLIASLLIKQKQEYAKERDAAISSEKALERSNRLQKNFLANMSHEIRSPLGIVLGFNSLIGESEEIDQIHQFSEDIDKAGNTLLTVINDILDYSKIESGKLDIIEADYSFEELMSEIKREIQLKCSQKGLKFMVNEDESIPKYLYGDNIRLKQCLLNILSNAVKYTETGVVCFGAKNIEYSKETGYKLRFIIKDTGKGISQDAMPKLFSAFQRLDEGANRGIEGTGLGMAITKNLLDEMNGDIQVESELGKGSTFTVIISQKKGSKRPEAKKTNANVNIKGSRILVVDDTELNLVLIRMQLEKAGCIITAIDNPVEGLEEANKNKYDIIMLDHMMPVMNGVDVFMQMRAQGGVNADTPVIMLTANAMAGACQEYLDMGFSGYVSKPIDREVMFETIAGLL